MSDDHIFPLFSRKAAEATAPHQAHHFRVTFYGQQSGDHLEALGPIARNVVRVYPVTVVSNGSDVHHGTVILELKDDVSSLVLDAVTRFQKRSDLPEQISMIIELLDGQDEHERVTRSSIYRQVSVKSLTLGELDVFTVGGMVTMNLMLDYVKHDIFLTK